MGFGILVVGYFITFIMSMTLYGWAIRLVGYIIMASACMKIKEYFPHFKYSILVLALLTISGGADAVLEISRLVGYAPAWFEQATVINGYARFALQLAFHFALLISVSFAAGSVDLPDKRISAVMDIVAVSFSSFMYILAMTHPRLNGVAVLVGLAANIMVLVLLFGCYMRICPEGDEDMPRGKTKIPFVDKINDSLEKRNLEEVEKSKAEIAARRRSLQERNERNAQKDKKKKK
mgnify:CR=1 FL=1